MWSYYKRLLNVQNVDHVICIIFIKEIDLYSLIFVLWQFQLILKIYCISGK